MRVAALYDIHGNLPALEAVLAELEDVDPDIVVVGGDVAAGPMPGDALDALLGLARPVRFVCGNGDRELVDAFDGASDPASLPPDWAELQRWAAGRLTRSQRDALAGFEATVVLAIDVLGATRFCHGSPRRDDELLTSATPAGTVAEACAGVAESVVVCGHTHVQFDRRIEASRLVNAGSVGLPYEGRPGAYWALLGPDVSLRRTAYDLDRAVERIRATGCPFVEEAIVSPLLDPPSPREATAAFERAAGR